MFGGHTANGSYLGDTWEWDGVVWMPRFAAVYPSARSHHGLAYDPLRSRTVLMGGQAASASSPIWEWNGSSWIAMGIADPLIGGSWRTPLAFDGLHGRILAGANRWWNGAALSVPVGSGGSGVSAIAWPQMAWDEARQRVVRFGRGNGYPIGTGLTQEFAYPPVSSVVTPYGTGCGTPPLALSPATSSQPRIGASFTTEVANVPFGFPFVSFGVSDQWIGPFPLPLVLDGFGFVGCLLHHDAITSQPCTLLPGGGVAQHALPIPNVPALLNSRLFLQAWSLAPGVNPGGVVLSNGLRIVIGNS